MVKNSQIANMPLDGGVLCLDFVNTVHHRKKEPLDDYFKVNGDILDWGLRTEIISETSYNILYKKIDNESSGKGSFMEKSIELRELLYRIFLGITLGKEIRNEDMNAFNQYLAVYFNSIAVKIEDDRFIEGWKWKGEDLNRVLLLVVKSAYDLLLSDRLDRVKECPSCGWLFLDTTKNGKRKWCSMKSCGSNIKALDYYYRKKKSG